MLHKSGLIFKEKNIKLQGYDGTSVNQIHIEVRIWIIACDTPMLYQRNGFT